MNRSSLGPRERRFWKKAEHQLSGPTAPKKKRNLDVNCRPKCTFAGLRSYHYTCLPDKNASQNRFVRKFAYRERTYILELTTEFERNATFWCFFRFFTKKSRQKWRVFLHVFLRVFPPGPGSCQIPGISSILTGKKQLPPPGQGRRWTVGWAVCVCVCDIWFR